MKISVIGAGYVGIPLAAALSKNSSVKLFDIDEKKVGNINKGFLPIKDDYLKEQIHKKNIKLDATTSKKYLFESNFVFISVNTDFSDHDNGFNTQSISALCKEIVKKNPTANIIIKSTVPIGFTSNLSKTLNTKNIAISPEFLSEGNGYFDTINPSRLVIGSKENYKKILDIYKKSYIRVNCEIFNVSPSEAEAIKLFSNTFLAMRVAFFNELDTFSLFNNFDTKKIIQGVCSDKRVGDFYNNPSFGFGGYCLPKDSKQLSEHLGKDYGKLIRSINESNDSRMEVIARKIIESDFKTIGFFRLSMKKGSDNFRESSSLKVLKLINENSKKRILIYEPSMKFDNDNEFELVKDINFFKSESDLIMANRLDSILDDVLHKIFSRDIFQKL